MKERRGGPLRSVCLSAALKWLSPAKSVPLMWSTWTTETLSEDRRAVLVELCLFAVFQLVLPESALRISDLRTDRSRCKQIERTTSHVLGRHYRVLPQRLVDDSLIEASLRRICGAKPPSHSNRTAARPVTEHTPEGVRSASSLTRGASPKRQRSRMARGAERTPVTNVGRSRDSTRYAVTSDGAQRTTSQRASPDPSRSPRTVLPRSLEGGRSLSLGNEATLLEGHGRSCERPRGFLRVSWNGSAHRSELGPEPSARKMPPTREPPKWNAGARRAAGIRRHLPWGSNPYGV
jgi:hypothetical protein